MLFAFNRYAVWVESFFYFYLATGDFKTINVSGVVADASFWRLIWSVGVLAVGLYHYGLRKRAFNLIGTRCTRTQKAFAIFVGCHKLSIGRTSRRCLIPDQRPRSSTYLHSVLRTSGIRYLESRVECFLDYHFIVHHTDSVVSCMSLDPLASLGSNFLPRPRIYCLNPPLLGPHSMDAE